MSALPKIPFSRGAMRRILSKDPYDLDDEEYKFLILRRSYLSDDEREKFSEILEMDYVLARLGTEYFQMLEERDKTLKHKFMLLTEEELADASKKVEENRKIKLAKKKLQHQADLKEEEKKAKKAKAKKKSVKKAKKATKRKSRRKK